MKTILLKVQQYLNTENRKKNLLVIFLLSLTAIAIWLGEILLIKGWHGLSWLHGTLYAPFVVTGFVVAAFMTPFVMGGSLPTTRGVIAFILLYTAGIFCYIAGAIWITLPYRMFFTNIYLFALLGFLLLLFLLRVIG